ncbi:MAG: hypothetical protein LH618_02710 [Saprospiraceae bacterium]|nr:hypothetical protein [Saprospiraceae bacterium]
MTTILLIEAIPLLQDALIHQLESSEQTTVTSILASLEDLPDQLETNQPDLLWLDGDLAGVKDSDLIRSLRKKVPNTKILLFGSGENLPNIKNTSSRAFMPTCQRPRP